MKVLRNRRERTVYRLTLIARVQKLSHNHWNKTVFQVIAPQIFLSLLNIYKKERE